MGNPPGLRCGSRLEREKGWLPAVASCRVLVGAFVACVLATAAVSCNGGGGGPSTVDSASANLAIEGGQPLGTDPPRELCTYNIGLRFTPLSLIGNDGRDSEFDKAVPGSISASLRDGQYYCDISLYESDLKAGTWRITVTTGLWSASCQKSFARNAVVFLKFREFVAGCV